MCTRLIVGMTAVAGLLAGCVAIHPEVDRRSGEAVLSAQGAQTLNPRPVRDPDAVSGIDGRAAGRAAKESMDRYVESFRAPAPNINVINIGGSLSDQAR
jgi:hypothetical protein